MRDLIIRHCHETGMFRITGTKGATLLVSRSFQSAEQVAVHLARQRQLEVWFEDTATAGDRAAGRKLWPRPTELRNLSRDRTPAALRTPIANRRP